MTHFQMSTLPFPAGLLTIALEIGDGYVDAPSYIFVEGCDGWLANAST